MLKQNLTKVTCSRHSSKEKIESITGMPLENIGDYLQGSQPKAIAEWFKQRKSIARILDRKDGGRKPVLIKEIYSQLKIIIFNIKDNPTAIAVGLS